MRQRIKPTTERVDVQQFLAENTIESSLDVRRHRIKLIQQLHDVDYNKATEIYRKMFSKPETKEERFEVQEKNFREFFKSQYNE